ncbi:hypothetical protein SBA4_1840026 [Candidatus Sulfopaludibacter sp. SbA4]|nr:hypothetical protein SBA4_1840026 [Candidatus Sulfopaludibacter sp. SbA4]
MLPAYPLIVDKKGAKIQPVEAGGPPGTGSGRCHLDGKNVYMADFARPALSRCGPPGAGSHGAFPLYGLAGATGAEARRAKAAGCDPGD